MNSDNCINQEVDFRLSEIFYSRTDQRGIIRSGNSVFFRVSGYEPDQLIGAPHRLVRHPDMPKAVFWLLWDSLGRGQPIAAYVKNRAADGRYYWVIAVVRPTPDGHLSVRVKPTSALFTQIPPLYATLRAEEEKGLSPRDSAAALVAAIGKMGFESYDAFMAEALRMEVEARLGAGIGRNNAYLQSYATMRESLDRLTAEQEGLMSVFSTLHLLPTNMRILASRLEASGGPVSAVSETYRLAVMDIFESLRGVKQQGDPAAGGEQSNGTLQRSLAQAMFDVASLLLQSECAATITADRTKLDGVDAAHETRMMAQLTEECERTARERIGRVAHAVHCLGEDCNALRTKMIGLDQIRIMGDIEAGRLSSQTELKVLMEQLKTFHSDIRERLATLISLSSDLRSRALHAAAA